MKKIIYILLLISVTTFSQEKEKIIFLFEEGKDTLINKKSEEIYKLAKLHSFTFDKTKHKKEKVNYDSIKPKIFATYDKFININKHKQYPDYFSKYSFYILIREENNTGCLVEVEKIWLVEDKIVD